jgi:hypothetical protein
MSNENRKKIARVVTPERDVAIRTKFSKDGEILFRSDKAGNTKIYIPTTIERWLLETYIQQLIDSNITISPDWKDSKAQLEDTKQEYYVLTYHVIRRDSPSAPSSIKRIRS